MMLPIIQEMDSHLYKLDVNDDQDHQTELPGIGYHGIGCYDTMVDIGGCQAGCIFCGHMDCKEIDEQC